MSTICVIFDGPPGPESGRFVEVETEEGNGISIGQWVQYPKGLWVLKIGADEINNLGVSIEQEAAQELAHERRRVAVEQYKQRLRERRWWHNIFPFRITFTRR